METDDLIIISPAIGVAARILFTLIFFLSGVTHFTAMQGYINLMPAVIPWRAFWVSISGLVELCWRNADSVQLSATAGRMADRRVSGSRDDRRARHLDVHSAGRDDARDERLDVPEGTGDDGLRPAHHATRRPQPSLSDSSPCWPLLQCGQSVDLRDPFWLAA